jgi:hypothetical protein
MNGPTLPLCPQTAHRKEVEAKSREDWVGEFKGCDCIAMYCIGSEINFLLMRLASRKVRLLTYQFTSTYVEEIP